MRQLRLFASLLLVLCGQAIWAADTGPSTPPPDPQLGKARQLIDRKDWAAASVVLADYTRANPANADGFNLLGYSYRHLQRYDESLAAYKKALEINPKHLGAHEYIGETYIQLRQFDKAKEHLSALDKLCFFSCEEYRDLKKAYEAAVKVRAN